jgi:hypothetical protein
MADRTMLRAAALLVLAGEVAYQVAQHFHFEGGSSPTEVFIGYANSRPWTIVHEAQFLAAALVLFGLLALSFALDASTGIHGLAVRFATATAVVALALNAVLYAVDGVALKQAVDVWVNASAAEKPAFYAAVLAVRGAEWGLRSYVDFTTGLALVLLAIPVAAIARIAIPVGFLVGLAGLVYLVQGYGYGAGDTAISDHFILSSTNYEFLTFVWALWLLVIALRMKAPDQVGPA